MNFPRAVRSPAVWRGIITIVAAIAVLTWPALLAGLIVLLVGIGAIAVGIVELVGWRTSRPRDQSDLIRGLILLVGGVVVLFVPTEPIDLLGAAIAAIIGIRSVLGIVQAIRAWRRNREDPFWPVVNGVLSLGLVISLLLIPDAVITLVVFAVAGSWIVSGVVVLVHALGDDDPTSPAPTDVAGVLKDKTMAPELRDTITAAIFEGMDSREGTNRYVALMAFATAIAALGVEADSTAVVIGAMLIAPLMSPIVALSAGILMGWFDRALYALQRVGLGVLIAVFVSFVTAIISPELVEITANSQVLSRTSPTLLDLLIALAAGGAGGYALSHPKVGNSLPGVAIAVALVPPLAVVGVSIQDGEFAFAVGASLLFLTNLVGIVIAGGAALVLSGYSPWTQVGQSGETTRRSFGLIAVSLVLVAIPLAVIGRDIVDQAMANSIAEDVVKDWLAGVEGASVGSIVVQGEKVTVVVFAPIDTAGAPDAESLADDMAEALSRPVDLSLKVIPESTFDVSSQ